MQQQQRSTNPLHAGYSAHSALPGYAQGCASPRSRSASSSGQSAAAQQLTPRRTAAAGTAAAGVPGLPRPSSFAGHRPVSGINRSPNNSTVCMASPRMSSGGGGRVPTASKPGWQHPQQQHQPHGYRQLPAGALSQDPVGPTLATYLGTSHPHNKAVANISSNNSRPSSGINRAGTASGKYTPILSGRAPSRQQHQQRPVTTAAAAAANSKLYSPRLGRPSTSSRGRPGSANTTTGQHKDQQQQQPEPAAGPLLSDYFRPPSAAAPGTVKMFGLPGMDRPGVAASPVPCVRVPSMKSSWDAVSAGISMELSSSSEQRDIVIDGVIGREGSPSPDHSDPKSPAVPPAGIPHDDGLQQLDDDYTHEVSRNQADEQAAGNAPFHSQRPGSRGVAGGFAGDSSQQKQSGGLDGDALAQPQLLLWSAAHEIDGRPVTRNGERTG